MVQFLDDDDVRRESGPHPVAYQAGAVYPFELLDDRSFERLVYLLKMERIAKGELAGRFDDAKLMPGVADRGRDVALRLNGQNVGVVQCKNLKKKVDRPTVMREIVKYVLHSFLDPELLPAGQPFTYFVAASTDFFEPALELAGPGTRVSSDPSFGLVVDEVIGSYAAFKGMTGASEGLKITAVLNAMTVQLITAVDLSKRLKPYSDLVAMFFAVEKVISAQHGEAILDGIESLRAHLEEASPAHHDEEVVFEMLERSLSDLYVVEQHPNGGETRSNRFWRLKVQHPNLTVRVLGKKDYDAFKAAIGTLPWGDPPANLSVFERTATGVVYDVRDDQLSFNRRFARRLDHVEMACTLFDPRRAGHYGLRDLAAGLRAFLRLAASQAAGAGESSEGFVEFHVEPHNLEYDLSSASASGLVEGIEEPLHTRANREACGRFALASLSSLTAEADEYAFSILRHVAVTCHGAVVDDDALLASIRGIS